MSTAPAWRVYKTVSASLRSLIYRPRGSRSGPPSLVERCVRFIGSQVQSYYKSIKLLPLELQDLVFECAREEGLLSLPQLINSIQPYTRSLNLSKYSSYVTDLGLCEGSTTKAVDVALIVPRLEALPEQGISDWEEVTSCSVATAMRGCPNLSVLNLSNCTSISLESLHRLLALPLQQLIISNTGFRMDTNDTICIRSASIRVLDISCTQQEFNLRHLPALEELRIGGRKTSGVETISSVSDARELSVVDLTGTRYGGRQAQFELNVLTGMLASLRKLRVLVFRDCHLTDDAYLTIITRCKGIRSLDLSRSTVSAPAIHNIVASAHVLEDLDISECRDLVNPEPILVACSLLRPFMNVRFVRYVK